MAGKVKGLILEIGGDTTKLNKALEDTRKSTSKIQSELRDVNKALKLDPKNTELLTQKQKLLSNELDVQKNKLSALKDAKKQADASMKQGTEVNEEGYRQLQREIVTAENKVKSLSKETSKFKQVGDKLGDVGGKMQDVGKKGMVVTAGIAAIGTAAVSSFKEVDEGADNAIAKTGATGEKAKDLEKVYKDVAATSLETFGATGDAVGELSARFGFTGDALKTASTDFLQFAKVNKIDVSESVRLVSRAMGDANIESKEYSSVLDMLTEAHQKTGIEVNVLAEDLAKYGAPMRALGLDTKESIALFGGWEKAGVNTEIAFAGMKKAIGNWSKEGKDSREEFSKTLDAIKSAPDISAATTLAIEAFGQKAGPDLADAIKNGRFEFNGLLDDLEKSDGATSNTFNAVIDDSDKMDLAVKQGKLALSGFGEQISGVLAPLMQGFANMVKSLTDKFAGLTDGQKKAVVVIGLVAAAIPPLILLVGTLFTLIATNPVGVLLTTLGLMVGALGAFGLASGDAKSEAQKLTDKLNDQKKAYDELKESADKQTESQLSQVDHVQKLRDELSKLVDENGNVKDSDKKRADFILSELNNALGTEYKMTGDVISNYQDLQTEIDKLIQKKKAEIIINGEEGAYKKAIEDRNQAIKDSAKLSEEYAAAQQKINDAQKEWEKNKDNVWTRTDAAKKLNEAKSASDAIKKTYDESEQQIKQYNDDIARYETDSANLIAGKTVEVVNSYNARQLGLKTAGDATAVEMRRQVETTATEYSNILDKVRAGEYNATDVVVTSAKERYEAALTENTKAGGAVGQGYIDGIKSKEDDVYNEGVAMSTKAYDGGNSVLPDFNKLGGSMAEGVTAGIIEKSWTVSDAMWGLAKDAVSITRGKLVVNSPSKYVAKLLGEPVSEGFAKGILDKGSMLIGALGSSIGGAIQAMKSQLGIKTSSARSMEEYGTAINQGLANGITKDMSPEKAIEQKLKNIKDIVSGSLSNLDVYLDTAKLEYESWEQANPDASEEEKAAHKKAYNDRQATLIDEKINASKAGLAAMQQNGASSIDIQKQKNEILGYQNSRQALTNDNNNIDKDLKSKQNDAANAQATTDVGEYFYGKKISDLIWSPQAQKYRSMGLTDAQIDKWAKEQSGYNQYKTENQNNYNVVNNFYTNNMSPAQTAQEIKSGLKRDAILA